MSMSTSVSGFKPANEKWKKMKKIYDSCEEADIQVPQEVWEFFNDEPPDNTGVKVEIQDHKCCSKYSEESESGFEIDVKKLPKDVTVIRFVNSW